MWLSLSLALLTVLAPNAFAQEPETTTKIPYIKPRPLPGGNLKAFEDFGRLLRDPLKRARMLAALRERIIPIRATFVPKPPFDPRFPKHVHGMAFVRELSGKDGAKRLVWQTPSALVREATHLSLKTPDGTWTRVQMKRLCDNALFAELDVPETLYPKTHFSEAPITTRGLTAAKRSLLSPGIPVLAVRNIESDYPILDTASLETQDELTGKDAWQVTKRFPSGTPLVTADGSILLIAVEQGLARFAVYPGPVTPCPKPAPTKKEDDP